MGFVFVHDLSSKKPDLLPVNGFSNQQKLTSNVTHVGRKRDGYYFNKLYVILFISNIYYIKESKNSIERA